MARKEVLEPETEPKTVNERLSSPEGAREEDCPVAHHQDTDETWQGPASRPGWLELGSGEAQPQCQAASLDGLGPDGVRSRL